MKKIITVVSALSLFAVASSAMSSTEGELERITAEEAFDLTQMYPEDVALVDVRSRAEYFWVGAACQVDAIEMEWKGTGYVVYPDYGKVLIGTNGRHVEFSINNRYRKLAVKKITRMSMSPISYNIPYKLWNEDALALEDNDQFYTSVADLVGGYGYSSLIFFCRSGGRSEACVDYSQLPAGITVYEIDQPADRGGTGGFEGTSYNSVYNGYRGFPGRLTEIQNEMSSVSWKDTGLPICTSLKDDLSTYTP